MSHIPVLLHSAIDSLDIKDGDVYVDATLGGGGHISEVCKRFGNKVRLIGIDADNKAILRVKEKLEECGCKANLFKENFRHIETVLHQVGLQNADKFLFDLGTSSDQIEFSGRGFSFLRDEPLLMTLDNDPQEGNLTAYEIVNSWSEKDIADLIYEYGEETFSRQIAKAIIIARKKKRIDTSLELAEIIEHTIGKKGKTHPATKTFQAFRIKVNDELGALEEGLRASWKYLSPGGRIAVISFHSLEDRIVKNYFASLVESENAKIIFKKPITPLRDEVLKNPKSRSAKLRVIEKTI